MNKYFLRYVLLKNLFLWNMHSTGGGELLGRKKGMNCYTIAGSKINNFTKIDLKLLHKWIPIITGILFCILRL